MIAQPSSGPRSRQGGPHDSHLHLRPPRTQAHSHRIPTRCVTITDAREYCSMCRAYGHSSHLARGLARPASYQSRLVPSSGSCNAYYFSTSTLYQVEVALMCSSGHRSRMREHKLVHYTHRLIFDVARRSRGPFTHLCRTERGRKSAKVALSPAFSTVLHFQCWSERKGGFGLPLPLARGPRVLIGWPLPLGFGLDGRLLLARRGRVYV